MLPEGVTQEVTPAPERAYHRNARGRVQLPAPAPGEAGAYHESVAVVSAGDAVHFMFMSDSAEMGCDVRSPSTL
jgi:hypothetical protein